MRRRSGLFLPDGKFYSFEEARLKNQELKAEIASRATDPDLFGLITTLPNPDRILRKGSFTEDVYNDVATDAHVFSVVQSRMASVLSKEWILTPGGTGRADKKAHDFAKEVLESLDMHAMITHILEALFWGFSVQEKMFATDGSYITIERIEDKPQRRFVFNTAGELRLLTTTDASDGEEIPIEKFVLSRHRATYDQPYGDALYAKCFWPYTFKHSGIKFWVIFVEKYGMPWIIGKHPRGISSDERTALLDRLEAAVQDAVMAICNDETVEFKDTGAKEQSSRIYDDLTHFCNKEISKVILGQTLTTEVSKEGGSYAASKTHEGVREDIGDLDKKLAASVINEQIIRHLVSLNFSGAAAPVYDFFEEEAVKKELAERDKDLVEQGVRFKKHYYTRVYNIPDEEFEVGFPGRPAPDSRADRREAPAPESPPEAGAAEHAEARPDPDQEAVDELIDGAAEQMTFEGLAAPVIEAIEQAESFEEIRERLAELYGEMDGAEFEELLAQAIFAANMFGRYAVGS